MKISGQITIKDPQVKTKSGTSKAGRPYSIREQYGLIRIGEEVRNIPISLDESQPAYEPGNYKVDMPLNVGRYGDLLVPRRLVLEK